MGVADVELHLLGARVHYSHYAEAQLSRVIWAAMICILQVISTEVNSQKSLDLLESLPLALPLEKPADDLNAYARRRCGDSLFQPSSKVC